MFGWLLVGAVCVQSARPPASTPARTAFMASATAQAAKCSPAAWPSLLQYLDTPAFRQNISTLSVKAATAADLAAWFIANVRAQPIITNFNYSHWDFYSKNMYLPTKWELQALGAGASGTAVEDIAETKLMGLPSFATALTPTVTESYDRPVYMAANIWKKADGNFRFGEQTMAIRPSLKQYMALSPVDTGRYVVECMPHKNKQQSNVSRWNCEGWTDHCWGTYTDFAHIILQHNIFFDYPLSDLFARFDLKAKAVRTDWYYEIPFSRSVLLPEVVHFCVAYYPVLWGNANGVAFRTWHISNERPLLWASGEESMLLDPVVGQKLATIVKIGTYVVSDADVAAWSKQWGTLKSTQWETLRNGTSTRFHMHFLTGKEAENQCKTQGTIEQIGINTMNDCVWTVLPACTTC